MLNQYLHIKHFNKYLPQRSIILLLIFVSFISSDLNAQTSIKGHIKLDSTWDSVAYLSLIPDLDEMLDISDEMMEWKTAGTKLYQQLPADCHESLREVDPLREIPKNRPKQEDFLLEHYFK